MIVPSFGWSESSKLEANQLYSSQKQSEKVEVVGEEEDSNEMARLLKTIKRHTNIATKSRMNADYVPGMVTVYTGEELLARGVETVGETIDFLNGIKSRLIRANFNSSAARGLFYKWMLNHTPVDLLSSSQQMVLIQIPISLVERIEIIQGPSSQIHGSYASGGLVHVITKQSGNQVAIGSKLKQQWSGAGVVTKSNKSGSLHLNLAAAVWQDRDPNAVSSLPITRRQELNSSNLTSVSSDPREYKSLFFNADI
ncbi:MAG: TonB-dependent receptor plug domain-containing protein [Magnetococcales bacterium]|nr:TonB-dependent receptor plug domain-containing protein [Magnetococcales bacterium]